ncbi:MAG TPA: anti-anti-sigma factor, partial [Pseudomonas sp.]|nr:anti-anti-sigma factor [Pseudomonas sp.]
MSQAAIRELTPGVLQLAGELDYLSAPALREQGARLIAA